MNNFADMVTTNLNSKCYHSKNTSYVAACISAITIECTIFCHLYNGIPPQVAIATVERNVELNVVVKCSLENCTD